MTQKNSAPPILLPQASDMPLATTSLWRWMWFFARPYRRTVIGFTAFRIVRNTIMAMVPFVAGRAINAFSDGWAYAHAELFCGILAGTMIVYLFVWWAVILFRRESMTEDRMIRGLTMFSIRHMNQLPLEWHEAQGSGSQLQRVMTARTSLQRLSRIYRWSVIPFLGMLSAIFISVVASHAPLWMLPLYAGMAVSFLVTAWLCARPMSALHKRHNSMMEKLLGGVYEFVSAIRTVKTFRMEGFIEMRARHFEAGGHDAMRDVLHRTFQKNMLLNMTGAFWFLTIFGVCVLGMFHHWMDAGTFAICFFLAFNLWGALEAMQQIQDEFLEARAGLLRLTETLTQAPRALDLAPVQAVPPGWPSIQFEDVTFHYPGHERIALGNVTLTIRRGEKVALVGRSGAGKSTLIKLLLKQAWCDGGMVRVGDTDLRQIDSTGWLQSIGYVPQDVELFNLSIRDNILLDRVAEADDTLYAHAVAQAALADFIASLPDGDATLVGERGVKLSGGQRQRLGIARALVRQAELIIFDEATSALDSLSEAAIREAMETAFGGKTVVLIAHRLATVRHVDRIFVLEDGRLIEQGSFEDLLRQDGLFARLWSLQSEAGEI